MVFYREEEPPFTKGALLVSEKSLYRIRVGRSTHMLLSEFVLRETLQRRCVVTHVVQTTGLKS